MHLSDFGWNVHFVKFPIGDMVLCDSYQFGVYKITYESTKALGGHGYFGFSIYTDPEIPWSSLYLALQCWFRSLLVEMYRFQAIWKVNRFIELCNPFPRSEKPFSRTGNSFPQIRQSVLSDWNSFIRFRQFVLSDCNSFPRNAIRSLELHNSFPLNNTYRPLDINHLLSRISIFSLDFNNPLTRIVVRSIDFNNLLSRNAIRSLTSRKDYLHRGNICNRRDGVV